MAGVIKQESLEDYSIFIPVAPVAKARPRLGKHGTFTPQKSKNAEVELRYWFANQKVPRFDGPLRVEITFHMPRPKSLKKGTIYHTKRPDADNLAKQVMDSGNGFLWDDDAAICDLRVIKCYSEETGITLAIRRLSV